MGLYIPGKWERLTRTEKMQTVACEAAMHSIGRIEYRRELAYEWLRQGLRLLVWEEDVETYDFEG